MAIHRHDDSVMGRESYVSVQNMKKGLNGNTAFSKHVVFCEDVVARTSPQSEAL